MAGPAFSAEAASRHLSENCPVMAELVVRHGPCTMMERKYQPFETLAASIIGQQLSVKAADTIERRVLGIIGGSLTPAGILSVEPEALRGCGLSNAKVRYIRTLAERVAAGGMDFEAMAAEPDDEVVIKALVELPGVGRWTAEMFLIFGLKRPDVLSLGDVGLQRAARLLYGESETLETVGRRWQPYRSIASWYLWQSLDAAPIGQSDFS
jgi:DNA-3-methyladenine glycosylase II